MRNLLFPILMFFGIPAFSQTGADSIRINDLKNQLSKSSGTNKVDLLNEIGWEYGWAGSIKDKSTVVSSFAMQAKGLALQLNYQRGIGYALIILSWGRNDNCDSLISAAMNIGEKEKDYKLLGRVYHRKWEMKTAYDYYKKAGDIQGEAEAATWLCTEYAGKGQYDNEFNYCQRAIELANIKKISTPTYSTYISSLAFETMSTLYSKVGDYTTAFQYLKEAEKYSTTDYVLPYAEYYKEIGKYDSSVYYYEKALLKGTVPSKLSRQVGTANFLAKNYRRAIDLLEKGFDWETDSNFKWQLPVNWRGSQHLEVALSYHALKNNEKGKKHYLAALKYQRPEYQQILNEKNLQKTAFQKASQLMDISYGLSKSFYGLHKLDSAYIYQEKYIHYKDEVNNINTILLLNMQLNNYKKLLEGEKKTSQIDLLNKDNQLKEQKINQQAFIKNGLIIGILLLFLLSVFVIRSLTLKRKNDKLHMQKNLEMHQLESEKKQAELEMQALRAQMNPHFIFNCLSSINRFILKNEPDTASDYLTRFSRLIRMVLVNSQKSLITLEDELDMLTIYLDMERLRFKNTFNYHIVFTNRVDAGAIYIPPLLLQPFCENAIWHGLRHLADPQSGRHEQGRLDIELSMDNKVLYCSITDNGIGRQKAAEIRSKSAEEKKSLGLKITTERLALLNQEKEVNTSYEISDLKNENGETTGTTVQLKISLTEPVEEFVFTPSR
jgi:hypothetical protein